MPQTKFQLENEDFIPIMGLYSGIENISKTDSFYTDGREMARAVGFLAYQAIATSAILGTLYKGLETVNMQGAN